MNTNNLLKLENQLCFSAYTASRLITKLYRPFLEQIGITYPQYLVMLVLWEEEGITLRDLGNRLYLDSGTLTPLLKRLEALKLINRERSSEDERLLCVTITNEGRLLKEKAKLIPECLLSSINIDTTELIQLKKGLDNLINSFEK
jgi:MarR family transcriptional regulator, organic hydroperoxide resistance regulator